MTTPRDDEFDIPSIVPERDEVASRGGRRENGTGGDKAAAAPPARRSGRLGGGARTLLTFLTLGMMATGGGAYYFYDRNQQILSELENTSGRLESLEQRLSAVGENTEETTLNLVERIDTNFSEIDKLWAARNENRGNIAANKEAIAGQKEVVASIEKAVENQADMINSADARLSNLANQVDNITENVSSIQNLDEQLEQVSTELTAVQDSISRLEPLSRRVQTAEEDIESINVYRLQTNQTLSQLQDQVRQLQERVGSQSGSSSSP